MRNLLCIQAVLPSETENALREMIEITRGAILAFEAETNAMALKQNMTLIKFTEEKNRANTRYQSAAREFMARQEEFLDFGGGLISELRNLQGDLKNKARLNMEFWEPFLPKNKLKKSDISANDRG